MVDIFNPKQVFIYALGLEPWYGYMMGLEYDEDSTQIIESDKMLAACENRQLKCEKLFGVRAVEYA